ncbi:MAG TPA: LytTR family DNA-binding domain-containing protein [Chitinophagaceae bacterium]|nr:LytTR family DNA-binding domain-containing protein [Chitinophagaceae bacterium]
MKKITCIIIDDEPMAVRLLQSYVSKVPFLNALHACYDGVEGLTYLKDNSVDLIFLDINMPMLNGIELANILTEKQKIIFTTAYSEHALESYEYHALDYLLKPITFKRFLKAVTHARDFFHPNEITNEIQAKIKEEAYMFVKSGKQLVKISNEEILFFEAQKEYVMIHTTGKKVMIYKRMKDLAEQIPSCFIRVHYSYIININFIDKIEGNSIIIGNHSIPIGFSYKEDFLLKIKQKTL